MFGLGGGQEPFGFPLRDSFFSQKLISPSLPAYCEVNKHRNVFSLLSFIIADLWALTAIVRVCPCCLYCSLRGEGAFKRLRQEDHKFKVSLGCTTGQK
jgi:hypothetical protein